MKHFLARALCLIVIPALLYSFFFFIHLSLLNKRFVHLSNPYQAPCKIESLEVKACVLLLFLVVMEMDFTVQLSNLNLKATLFTMQACHVVCMKSAYVDIILNSICSKFKISYFHRACLWGSSDFEKSEDWWRLPTFPLALVSSGSWCTATTGDVPVPLEKSLKHTSEIEQLSYLY